MGSQLSMECDRLSGAREWQKLLIPQRRLLAVSELHDVAPERAACGQLCDALVGTGDARSALIFARREVQLAQHLDDKSLELRAQGRLMGVHSLLEDGKEVLRLVELMVRMLEVDSKCLTLQAKQEAKQDVMTMVNKFKDLAPVQLQQQAAQLLQTEIAAPEILGGGREEALRLMNLGNTAASNGDLPKARKLLEKSLQVAPSAIAYKVLGDVAWSQGDTARRSEMLAQGAQLALQDTKGTSLQHQVVILGAWHNDLSQHGEHLQAAEVRPQLSARLQAQSTKGALGTECPVCLEEFRPSQACWVLQRCRHLLHSDCLKRHLRSGSAQWYACPLCKQQMGGSDIQRLGVQLGLNGLPV